MNSRLVAAGLGDRRPLRGCVRRIGSRRRGGGPRNLSRGSRLVYWHKHGACAHAHTTQ